MNLAASSPEEDFAAGTSFLSPRHFDSNRRCSIPTPLKRFKGNYYVSLAEEGVRGWNTTTETRKDAMRHRKKEQKFEKNLDRRRWVL